MKHSAKSSSAFVHKTLSGPGLGFVLMIAAFSQSPAFAQGADWWRPAPFTGLTWQWQIGSVPAPGELLDVDMYDIDLFETPASTIQAMKDQGIIVTCYFSAGTYEGWRPDWQDYFDFITGDTYSGSEAPFLGNMADWDERWLDVREIALLEPIMRGRMAMARAKGCDAVEPDNMDSYTNKGEANPTGAYGYDDQLAYNRAVARWAHDEGLSVALKNDVDQLADLVDDFDWALNEQCYQYNECDGYQVFVDAGKAVVGVEYSGDTASFCPDAYDAGYSWLKKKLSLNAWVEPCGVKDDGSAVAENRSALVPAVQTGAVLSGDVYDLAGRKAQDMPEGRGLYISRKSGKPVLMPLLR